MNLPRLKDETEFERLALDTATPLVVPQYGWVDLRKGPPGDVGFICGPITEGGSERFAATLRPLLFGAAWKVLDRVVECAFPPRDKHWTNSARRTGRRPWTSRSGRRSRRPTRSGKRRCGCTRRPSSSGTE